VTTHATCIVGTWSATAAALLFSTFGVALVVDFWIPTAALGFAVCLAAAPAFVAMMGAISLATPSERAIWGRLGASFATIYAVLVSIVYYLQLAVLGSGAAALSPEATRLLVFAPGSVTFAIDMLGYSFMTLATLAAAPAFAGHGLDRWIRRLFVLHGLMVVPTVLAPLLMTPDPDASSKVGNLVLIGWVLVFVPLASLVALRFRRVRRRAAVGPARDRPSHDTRGEVRSARAP
jgi:hypothetical protein